MRGERDDATAECITATAPPQVSLVANLSGTSTLADVINQSARRTPDEELTFGANVDTVTPALRRADLGVTAITMHGPIVLRDYVVTRCVEAVVHGCEVSSAAAHERLPIDEDPRTAPDGCRSRCAITLPLGAAGLGHVSGARLILTCGLPGAGKTALARQLAADRRAVRLTKDEWLTALGSSPWDAPTRERVERELWHLAQEILRLGLSVVVDFGLWARTERDEMRSVARRLGVGVELHYLDISTDELWRRIEARNSQPPWDRYPIRRTDLDAWLLLFDAPDAAEVALFDLPPTSN